MNGECVESVFWCLPNKTLQIPAFTAPPDTGNQSSWKMNSIHYHDVKSCVVATGEKYKLHLMPRVPDIDGVTVSHFLCETPADPSTQNHHPHLYRYIYHFDRQSEEWGLPGGLWTGGGIPVNVRINELPMNRMVHVFNLSRLGANFRVG